MDESDSILAFLKSKKGLGVVAVLALVVVMLSSLAKESHFMDIQEEVYEEIEQMGEVGQGAAAKLHLTVDTSEEDARRFQAFLLNHQNPDKCVRSQIKSWHHGAGLGSELQIWKNTFLRAVASNKILASGFDSQYVNLAYCPSKDLEQCVFQPISRCRAIEGNYPKSYSSCAVFNTKVLSERAGLTTDRGLFWFHAQALKFLLRPREVVTKTYDAVLKAMDIDDISQVLAIHVRHGDVSWDGRKRIHTYKYARVAKTFITWYNFKTVFVGSDDSTAFDYIKGYLNKGNTKNVTVVQMPSDIFQLKEHHGMVSARMKHMARQKVARDEDLEIPETLLNFTDDSSGIPDAKTNITLEDLKAMSTNETFVPHKDEGVALLVEMMLMAKCGGFIGTINSNFGRTIQEIQYGLPAHKRGFVYDMENRPYFGCAYKKALPFGGGGQMFPYH